jgi:hypothetical protein
MSEINVFEVIDEEVAVLSSFFKVLLEFSAYVSFITKIGNNMIYQEIQGNAKNMIYQEVRKIVRNI